MKEKRDMWVPLKKKQTNIIVKREELEQKDGEETEGFNFFFLSIYFSLRSTEIGP